MSNLERITYNGQEVDIVKDEQGNAYIPLKRICENLGIDAQTQINKIRNDERFRYKDMLVPSAGGNQTSFSILYDCFGGWLYGINPNKVKETVRCALIKYQSELTGVIHDYLTKGYAINEKKLKADLIELQWKNKFLAEDVTKEKSLRSRAVRQADHNLRRLRQVLIDTRIKESELKIDTPNKDGNLINRIIPTYSKHDPRLGGKIKKLDDNQPYLPSLAFKPKAQGE